MCPDRSPCVPPVLRKLTIQRLAENNQRAAHGRLAAPRRVLQGLPTRPWPLRSVVQAALATLASSVNQATNLPTRWSLASAAGQRTIWALLDGRSQQSGSTRQSRPSAKASR